jgi:hypothetical protein
MLIKIPKAQHATAKNLFSLSNNQWQIFCDALSTVDANYDLDIFLNHIDSSIDESAFPDVRKIASMLLRLCTVKSSLKLGSEDFVKELMLAAQYDELISNVDSIDELSTKLIQVFTDESTLHQSAKIRDLMWDRPNCVENVRVLSDLRPVFGTNADSSPQSFLIDHTLRVVYQTAAGVEEVHLSLDGEGLRELGKEIDRAIRKEGKLIDYVRITGTTVHTGHNEDQD